MLVRNKLELMIEEAIAAAYGTELEPDDKDGTFL
jgi:hypothetical protein